MPRKRKEVVENGRIGKEKPQQRNAANARERARMRVLSRSLAQTWPFSFSKTSETKDMPSEGLSERESYNTHYNQHTHLFNSE
ncbi:hypothetical protein Avbf_12895 [Armadillidium vulgare]|nr:hypothetical protein Avbf_12895 [Armadillidium vulgare]